MQGCRKLHNNKKSRHTSKLPLDEETIIRLGCTYSIFLIYYRIQLSCQKTASAQSTISTTYKPLNKILYATESQVSPCTISFWVADTDGTSPQQIPINLPSGLSISSSSACLTLDGQTLIFEVNSIAGGGNSLYSCSIDGSNLKQIVQGSTSTTCYINSTY